MRYRTRYDGQRKRADEADLQHPTDSAPWFASDAVHIDAVGYEGRPVHGKAILPQQPIDQPGRHDEAKVFYKRIVQRFDGAGATQVTKTVVRGSKSRLAGGDGPAGRGCTAGARSWPTD